MILKTYNVDTTTVSLKSGDEVLMFPSTCEVTLIGRDALAFASHWEAELTGLDWEIRHDQLSGSYSLEINGDLDDVRAFLIEAGLMGGVA